MVSDLRLLDEAIVCEGNVGIGISNPERTLQIQGTEVHSGGSGAGYSFSDRKTSSIIWEPKNGERWVWYASEGKARLWSGGDKFLVGANGNVGIGISDPKYKLDVADRMQVRQGASQSAGIWFHQKTPNKEQAFIGMAGDTQIGFYGNTGCGWGMVMDTTTGFVGIGTGQTTPLRPLHVVGKEIHTEGVLAGFSFSDRKKKFVETPSNGERWVWYASNGCARLWSGEDKLVVDTEGTATFHRGLVARKKTVAAKTDSSTSKSPSPSPSPKSGNKFLSTTVVVSAADGRYKFYEDSLKAVNWRQVDDHAKEMIKLTIANAPALIADYETGNVGIGIPWVSRDHKLSVGGDMAVEGNVSVAGNLTAETVTNTSSKILKENIIGLSVQEAVSALLDLNPVKFNFKADDEKELHVGFIAEDVPELVAMANRKTLSPMDIVAVLTKVVQEQQQQITGLMAKFDELSKA